MKKKILASVISCIALSVMVAVPVVAAEEIDDINFAIEEDTMLLSEEDDQYKEFFIDMIDTEENTNEESLIIEEDDVTEDVLTSGNFEYEILEDGTACITDYVGDISGDLVIPDTVDGCSVTSIGDKAFEYCSDFTGSLTIPSSVTSIGYSAFEGCRGFTGSLTIPSSVTYIGDSAFRGCNGFTGDLIIPDGVTSIGADAFEYCSGFTGSLIIPSSVTSIGSYAFYNCSGFTGSLTIPSGVTSIDSYAFYNCSGFTGSLTIPSSVTSIGSGAFWGCSGFTGSLTIPSSVETIENDAFYGCSGFTKIINKSQDSIELPNVEGYYWSREGSDVPIAVISNGTAIRHAIESVYTVKFNSNGGSTVSSAKVKNGDKITKPANPKKTGYTFVGWYKDSALTNAWDFTKDTVTKNITLYAKWKINTYTITYKLNGGKNGKNPASYKVTTADITLKNPTKTGYTFKGWYTDSKFTKKITVIKKGSTGNKTLYAKWAANKYTIKFNANGGTGSMKNKAMTYDKKAKLTKNAFKRKGYTFKGWATSKANAKAGKIKYKNAAEVKNLTSKSGGTVTLYAVWKKK